MLCMTFLSGRRPTQELPTRTPHPGTYQATLQSLLTSILIFQKKKNKKKPPPYLNTDFLKKVNDTLS